jgi:segregation and condensation protein B
MEKREIIEALIFVSDGSRTLKDIRQALPETTAAEVEALVAELNRIYDQTGRSFRIIPAADGYMFVTKPEYTAHIRAVSSPIRLSQAALEVLAVIAYKGPCTRQAIEIIRGVDSTSALKNLLKGELIDIKPGKPMQYYTTNRFLEVFGLRTLSELPDIAQFEEVFNVAQEGSDTTDQVRE